MAKDLFYLAWSIEIVAASIGLFFMSYENNVPTLDLSKVNCCILQILFKNI